MTEFELIDRYFHRRVPLDASIRLGMGDDCALLNIAKTLAISTDTLVEGVHFFADAAPYDLGYKALVVNLSDLAAMGARPLAFLLSLTLSDIADSWLAPFSQGLHDCADAHAIYLVGGNTARGPLNINITVLGELTEQKALRRDSALLDDDIYVTGSLGGAALGLQILQNKIIVGAQAQEAALTRFHHPTPRVALAQALVGIAHAAIDISDGLAQDLMHILKASRLGAEVWQEALPIFAGSTVDLALHGGEDYELCFTAPVLQRDTIFSLQQKFAVPITRIGKITEGKTLVLLNAQRQSLPLTTQGYQHF